MIDLDPLARRERLLRGSGEHRVTVDLVAVRRDQVPRERVALGHPPLVDRRVRVEHLQVERHRRGERHGTTTNPTSAPSSADRANCRTSDSWPHTCSIGGRTSRAEANNGRPISSASRACSPGGCDCALTSSTDPVRRRCRRPGRRTASCRDARRRRRARGARCASPARTMRPFSITRMTSAPRIVDNRCAITKLVRSRRNAFIASWIKTSVRVSTELVASSRIRIAGSARNARGDRQQLLLPGADVVALFVDHRVVAVGQRVHEAVDVGGARGLEDLLLGRVGIAVRDVLADRAAEEPRVLQHHADLRAQLRARDRRDAAPVERDLAPVQLVEPHDQVDERGLARAGRADDRDRLAGLGDERERLDQRAVRVVRERDVAELDAPAHRRRVVAGRPGRGSARRRRGTRPRARTTRCPTGRRSSSTRPA